MVYFSICTGVKLDNFAVCIKSAGPLCCLYGNKSGLLCCLYGELNWSTLLFI